MSFKLATSRYSFHRFGEGPEGNDKPTLREMVERCAELELDGLELLGYHIDNTAPEELNALRGFAAQKGVALIAVSAHHNFVNPDPAKRRADLAFHDAHDAERAGQSKQRADAEQQRKRGSNGDGLHRQEYEAKFSRSLGGERNWIRLQVGDASDLEAIKARILTLSDVEGNRIDVHEGGPTRRLGMWIQLLGERKSTPLYFPYAQRPGPY